MALIVFGPRRLPEIADAFGSSIKRFRKATKDVKDEVRREIDSADVSDSTPPKDNDQS